MTVVGLHPEELFDQLAAGSLTSAGAERLRQHLEVCSVCRFELSLRGDFRADLERLDARARSEGAPNPTPERLPETAPLPVRRSRGGRSRRRVLAVVSLAAAFAFVATGALASAFTGVAPWQLLDRLVSDAPRAADSPAPVSRRPSSAPAGAASSGSAAASVPRVAEPTPPVPASTPAPVLMAPSAAAPSADADADAPSRQLPRSQRAAFPTPDGAVDESAAELFAAANSARAAGETARAITLYRKLQARHPRSSESRLSELTLATLLLHNGDARAALAGFDAYLARGGGALEAEALVGRALCRRALGQRELELSAWRTVAERFPGTSYARRARERLGAPGER